MLPYWGDEFIALIDTRVDSLEVLKEKFEEVTNNWKGTYTDSLRIAYGAVEVDITSKSLNPFLEKADSLMYECKSKYYRESNIDRRKR